jgi:hypothetical protein
VPTLQASLGDSDVTAVRRVTLFPTFGVGVITQDPHGVAASGEATRRDVARKDPTQESCFSENG